MPVKTGARPVVRHRLGAPPEFTQVNGLSAITSEEFPGWTFEVRDVAAGDWCARTDEGDFTDYRATRMLQDRFVMVPRRAISNERFKAGLEVIAEAGLHTITGTTFAPVPEDKLTPATIVIEWSPYLRVRDEEWLDEWTAAPHGMSAEPVARGSWDDLGALADMIRLAQDRESGSVLLGLSEMYAGVLAQERVYAALPDSDDPLTAQDVAAGLIARHGRVLQIPLPSGIANDFVTVFDARVAGRRVGVFVVPGKMNGPRSRAHKLMHAQDTHDALARLVIEAFPGYQTCVIPQAPGLLLTALTPEGQAAVAEARPAGLPWARSWGDGVTIACTRG